ncbi:239R [Invertebrate iridescent virus Kaz2018]|uniref:239R n=1 Tax=Invertebrate iridescent virus 6 TaxID=176652 RepID=Q91FT3_IIV6|nr:239R [Invertebrate iridescent virus 6]AAK82100.1 239R [Invertebrate iridescent virus 6]QNH08649.1 239R [Invertebrate iridescent virus Kaz2018]
MKFYIKWMWFKLNLIFQLKIVHLNQIKIKEENVFFFLNVMTKIILIIQLELKILMQKKH